MYKTTVSYENPFTEEVITETLYFNFTKAELLELEMPEKGQPISEALTQFVEGEIEASKVLSVFKRLVTLSYGKRIGDKFVKNDDIRAEFEGSEAYSEVLLKLVQDEKEAVRFISNLMPKDVMAQVKDKLDPEQQALFYGDESENALARKSVMESLARQQENNQNAMLRSYLK